MFKKNKPKAVHEDKRLAGSNAFQKPVDIKKIIKLSEKTKKNGKAKRSN